MVIRWCCMHSSYTYWCLDSMYKQAWMSTKVTLCRALCTTTKCSSRHDFCSHWVSNRLPWRVFLIDLGDYVTIVLLQSILFGLEHVHYLQGSGLQEVLSLARSHILVFMVVACWVASCSTYMLGGVVFLLDCIFHGHLKQSFLMERSKRAIRWSCL